MTKLTTETDVLVEAMRTSHNIEVDESGTRVRPVSAAAVVDHAGALPLPNSSDVRLASPLRPLRSRACL